jgi:hypothetical protein
LELEKERTKRTMNLRNWIITKRPWVWKIKLQQKD